MINVTIIIVIIIPLGAEPAPVADSRPLGHGLQVHPPMEWEPPTPTPEV